MLIHAQFARALDQKFLFDQAVQDVCAFRRADGITRIGSQESDSLLEGFGFDRYAVDGGRNPGLEIIVELRPLAKDPEAAQNQPEGCAQNEKEGGSICFGLLHAGHAI